jgi:hypothetical protein
VVNPFHPHIPGGRQMENDPAFRQGLFNGFNPPHFQADDPDGFGEQIAALSRFVRRRMLAEPERVTIDQAASYLHAVNLARIVRSEQALGRSSEFSSARHEAIKLACREWGIDVPSQSDRLKL